MDIIVYIIVASLTIGGVLGRITSYKDISVLTKKTETDKTELNKKLDSLRGDMGEIYDRLGAVERRQAETGVEVRNLGKQIDRLQTMLERALLK